MKSKEKELLLLLHENCASFQNAASLAEQLQLSERTIRTYIRGLEHTLKDKGAVVQAKQGRGYQLMVTDHALFDPYIHQISHRQIQQKMKTMDTSADRQSWILNRLLLRDEKLLIDGLCDELYVSRSTITKDLKSVSDLLAPYHLTLQSKAGSGIQVVGEESEKRAFIMDYFFRDSKFDSLREYLDHSGYFDDLPVESLIMIILEEARRGQITLSDVMIQNILLHLGLSIKRSQKGLRLSQIEYLDRIPDTREFQTASRILQRLEQSLNMVFPPEEAAYLTLHLGVKGSSSFSISERQKDEIREEIIRVLIQIDMETGCLLHEDERVIGPLLEHMVPLIIRLRQKIRQDNPLTEEIMRDHPDIFWMTRQYFSTMPSLQGMEIDNDEWAYLTLHIMAAMESSSEQRKLQVLLICATGYGSSQLLKNRIDKEFGDSVHIVRETGYFNMNDDFLKGIDLIISSVNIGPVIFGVPFIHVSLFLNDEDIAHIREFISHHNSRSPNKKVSGVSRSRREWLFDTFITSDIFQVFDQPVSREAIMKSLIRSLADGETEGFEKHMEDQVALRQQLGSIIFSDSIAVPHPAMPVSKEARIAVGLVPQGCRWNEEYPAIRIVFLLSPSYVSNEGIHHTVSGIVSLIDHPEVQKQILEKPTYENFRELFINML